jgi:hypothetical protein
MLLRLQLDLCFVLLSHSFSRGYSQLDKGSLPRNVNWFHSPTISRLLLLEIGMFRGPRLLKTYLWLIGSAMPVVRRVILPTSAQIHALALFNNLHLHLHMEPTLFMLLPRRTMPTWESTMLLWRKLQTFSLIYFPSMTLLQLCYLILEHHILSYVMSMLRSIICP